jgi:hypothetical protein
MATLTSNINYLQPTSFKLSIDRTNYPNLEFFVQNFTHPGLMMPASEMPIRRMQSIPYPGESLTINELSATILLDENMESYSEMYNWIRRIQVADMDGNKTRQRGGAANPHADITLSILSSHNNLSKQVRYLDAIPTTGTEFITFQASFRFSYFELLNVNTSTGSITNSFTVTS